MAMDKSSFQKLFKELYQINPDQWNGLLSKAGKTQFGKKAKPSKMNRQTISSPAFDKLMKIDWGTFREQGNKTKEQNVQRPQSVRINGMTLPETKRKNMRNANAEVTHADSSAVESFKYDPEKKNLDIKFVGNDKEYRYPKVPRNVVNAFYAAPSKGAFVNNVVSRYSNINDPEVRRKMAQE